MGPDRYLTGACHPSMQDLPDPFTDPSPCCKESPENPVHSFARLSVVSVQARRFAPWLNRPFPDAWLVNLTPLEGRKVEPALRDPLKIVDEYATFMPILRQQAGIKIGCPPTKIGRGENRARNHYRACCFLRERRLEMAAPVKPITAISTRPPTSGAVRSPVWARAFKVRSALVNQSSPEPTGTNFT